MLPHQTSQPTPFPTYPAQDASETNHAIWSIVFGVMALIIFVVCVLPMDLTLFTFSGWLKDLAQFLNPLALGGEIYVAPIGILVGIIGTVWGWQAQRETAGIAGYVLGLLSLVAYATSIGLFVLSFAGVLKPLI